MLFIACNPKPAKPTLRINKITPVAQIKTASNTLNGANNNAISQADSTESGIDDPDAFADYYVVVADTGLSYHELHTKMLALNQTLNTPIDTMDRGYNSKKDLIALPEDSDDDMYAGDYFPRRYPSSALSLEYMQFYKPNSAEKTIALVTGIYESKTSADSALNALKPSAGAFAVKAHIYVGCMH
ncbi:hypothetical protein BC343_11375 [Mucilaginibacter pedocola]|uniref:SPOR domain-containing protein n=1 Tax=Mucilaginibacter pedocola TaxID=1792845 RepID=A0A1S9PB79_9SPHI|nr:hypothetical protein BC343_11375 [Mucilaginibacter pedocola]